MPFSDLSAANRGDAGHFDGSAEAFRHWDEDDEVSGSCARCHSEDITSNLCMLCHQGRESSVSVDRRIGDSPDNEVAEGLGFANIHYFAAGATLFGNEVMGAYPFDGQEYLGRNQHVPGFDTCAGCHNVHELEVKTDACVTCTVTLGM